METIEPFILKALLQNGFTQETIQAKTPQELREIYKKGVAKYIQGFSPEKKYPPIKKLIPSKISQRSKMFIRSLLIFANIFQVKISPL